MQQALRVGKRVHAETGIDRAGQSIVSAALALAPDGVAGTVGAGDRGRVDGRARPGDPRPRRRRRRWS